MSDRTVVMAPFSGPLRAAWLWDCQVRTLPLRWHPDWLPFGGWPTTAQALPSIVPVPEWVAKRLGPLPGWGALNSLRMKPALCSLEQSVVMLAKLALHLRPQDARHLLTDRQWLSSDAPPHPSVTQHGMLLKPIKAAAPGLAEWAAVGLHDWGQMLSHRERAAYLLLRRCFPARSTVRWVQRIAAQPVVGPTDWESAFQTAETH